MLYFLLIILFICVIGVSFHGDMKDLRLYTIGFLTFSTVLVLLRKGYLHTSVSVFIFLFFLNMLHDILRFEFTSYEKIVETMMEAFLSYVIIGLIATKKRHIVYIVASSIALVVLHEILIYQFVYSNTTFPQEGFKYFIGAVVSVILLGFVIWMNIKVNDESLIILQQRNERLMMHMVILQEM